MFLDKIMGKGKCLSQYEEGMIYALRNEGYSYREISKKVKRTITAIHNVLKRDGTGYKFKNSGRKRINNQYAERRLGQVANANKGLSSTKLADAANFKGSKSTVCRILRNVLNKKCKKIKKRIIHNQKQKDERVQWARNNMFLNFGKDIIFSDEKRFCFSGPDGYYKAWIGPEEDYCVCITPKCGGIHIWGAIYQDRLIGISVLGPKETFNSQKLFIFFHMILINYAFRYIDILKLQILPFYEEIDSERPKFLQDNARPHVSKVTKQFFNDSNIPLLEIPPKSPDINAIENFWAQLSRKVYSNGKIYSSGIELKEGILMAISFLNENDNTIIQNTTNSINTRCMDILQFGGKLSRF